MGFFFLSEEISLAPRELWFNKMKERGEKREREAKREREERKTKLLNVQVTVLHTLGPVHLFLFLSLTWICEWEGGRNSGVEAMMRQETWRGVGKFDLEKFFFSRE